MSEARLLIDISKGGSWSKACLFERSNDAILEDPNESLSRTGAGFAIDEKVENWCIVAGRSRYTKSHKRVVWLVPSRGCGCDDGAPHPDYLHSSRTPSNVTAGISLFRHLA